MSVTVTPIDTGSAAPRFSVAVSSSSGAAITAVSLTRTAQGVTEYVRQQPAPGPSPRLVNDYAMPWATPVVYTATVTTAAGTETFSSPTAVIDPQKPWLIHPTTPALSRVLDSGTFQQMGVVSIGAVTRPATTTAHDIIGSEFRVITKSGPRAASRTQLEVATVTADEQQALLAMTRDQTPLLIRMPGSWQWDWEDGYYDVGQIDVNRFFQYGPERRRVFTLPLERVEAPAGGLQAERTCADVLAAFSTCSDVSAAYATSTDLLTDTRR